MTANSLMSRLESYGTAQNRKVYGRHGVKRDMYGVSYANLKTLKKELKTAHALALELWETGNHDARVLATMIADPARLDEPTIEAWADQLDSYVITDAFAGLIGKTALSAEKMKTWTRSDDEWKGQAGWILLSTLAMKDKALPESFFQPYLRRIETSLHEQKNRVRYSMNNALIAIGIRSPELEKQALRIAEHIGVVEVDHGATGCKTPDASSYIAKTLKRKSYLLAS